MYNVHKIPPLYMHKRKWTILTTIIAPYLITTEAFRKDILKCTKCSITWPYWNAPIVAETELVSCDIAIKHPIFTPVIGAVVDIFWKYIFQDTKIKSKSCFFTSFKPRCTLSFRDHWCIQDCTNLTFQKQQTLYSIWSFSVKRKLQRKLYCLYHSSCVI